MTPLSVWYPASRGRGGGTLPAKSVSSPWLGISWSARSAFSRHPRAMIRRLPANQNQRGVELLTSINTAERGPQASQHWMLVAALAYRR